jgi:hypothetical protein
MERYYQRLNESEQAAATNQFNKLNFDRLNGQTNLLGASLRPVDGGTFDSPFNMTPDSGVFDSVRRERITSVFGSSDNTLAMPTPDDVRMQAEQKARLETMRQIWNIDQPAAAPTMPVSASAPVDSGPLFGLSSPGVQSASPFSPSVGNASSSQSLTPVQSPVTTQRAMRPPRADFAAPQRPF